MVQLHSKNFYVGKGGEIVPTMHRHMLLVLKDSGPFKENEELPCFIAQYGPDQFAVWWSHWEHHNKYKCFTQSELHDTFQEGIVNG